MRSFHWPMSESQRCLQLGREEATQRLEKELAQREAAIAEKEAALAERHALPAVRKGVGRAERDVNIAEAPSELSNRRKLAEAGSARSAGGRITNNHRQPPPHVPLRERVCREATALDGDRAWSGAVHSERPRGA